MRNEYKEPSHTAMNHNLNYSNNNQMSLFAAPVEKGNSEWSVFGAVRSDRATGMYRVAQPSRETRYSVTTMKRVVRPQSLFFNRQTNQ